MDLQIFVSLKLEMFQELKDILIENNIYSN